MTGRIALIAALATMALGCAEDPQYIDPGLELTFDPSTLAEDEPPPTVIFDLPIDLETEDEQMERQEYADAQGLPIGQVAYVTRDDLELSLEWSVENLSDGVGRGRIQLNGANEFFNYVPAAFVIDPEEDEEPPSLLSSVPFDIPEAGTVGGVFREDELREMAIDLELITRAGFNPFAAIFDNQEDLTEITTTDGLLIPEEAIASIVRFDVGIEVNVPVVLRFQVRARDRDDMLHDELGSAVIDELTVFSPVDFAPPPLVPEN